MLVVNAEAIVGEQKSRSACGGLHQLETVLGDPRHDPAGAAVVTFEPFGGVADTVGDTAAQRVASIQAMALVLVLQKLAERASGLATKKAAEWRRLRESVFETIVVFMLHPLFHGGRLDVVNKGAGATRAAIKAVRDGLFTVDTGRVQRFSVESVADVEPAWARKVSSAQPRVRAARPAIFSIRCAVTWLAA